MKLKMLLILIGLLIGRLVPAQSVLPKDSLIADFRLFVKYLEETHPDPYSGFGGKVFFHQKVSEAEWQLKNQNYTGPGFVELVSAFLAPLGDGHTRLSSNASSNNLALQIPVQFKVISDGIILVRLPDDLRPYLGSRLIALNGVPVEKLLDKAGQLTPCENQYGKYLTFIKNAVSQAGQKRLTPDMGEVSELLIQTPAGKQEKLVLQFADRDSLSKIKSAVCPEWDRLNDMPYMSWCFLDDKEQVMYFRLQSVMAREAYLFMRKNGWEGLNSQVQSFYKYTLKKEMPEDIDRAIAGMPSMAEEFRNMLVEMKKYGTPDLVVDLRSNGGGFTPITLVTLYQMFGDRYLTTDMNTRFYRLLSPLYMRKINMSLHDFNKQYGTEFEFGDYTFGSESDEQKDAAQLRNDFVNGALGDAPDVIRDLEGKPVYTPAKIFVITDEGTFSAAFHYAFYLWKMGAVIVGVPSSQAPNTFMESTPFELQRTGTNGSISNSAQYFLPPADKRAKTFYPDLMPAYKDYVRYGFDKHAEILFLLDYLKKK